MYTSDRVHPLYPPLTLTFYPLGELAESEGEDWDTNTDGLSDGPTQPAEHTRHHALQDKAVQGTFNSGPW